MLTKMSEPDLLILGGMVLAFASMLAVRIGYAVWGHIQFERAYRRHPRVIPYNDAQLCPAGEKPHTWQKVNLVVRDLAPGIYTVCMECGYISGNTKYMVSNEVLDQANEALKKAHEKRELEAQIMSRVSAIVDHKVTAYIHSNFPKESNDPTFVMKLIELAELTLRAQDEAVEKVATEIEVQKDSNHKADSWSSDVKGNA